MLNARVKQAAAAAFVAVTTIVVTAQLAYADAITDAIDDAEADIIVWMGGVVAAILAVVGLGLGAKFLIRWLKRLVAAT